MCFLLPFQGGVWRGCGLLASGLVREVGKTQLGNWIVAAGYSEWGWYSKRFWAPVRGAYWQMRTDDSHAAGVSSCRAQLCRVLTLWFWMVGGLRALEGAGKVRALAEGFRGAQSHYRNTSTHAQPRCPLAHISWPAHLESRQVGAMARKQLPCCQALVKVRVSHRGDVRCGGRRGTSFHHLEGGLPKKAPSWKADRTAERMYGEGEMQKKSWVCGCSQLCCQSELS